jgi:hypothetical protein
MSLLEVKNLKVHFPVKHWMFSRGRSFASCSFAALTPIRIALNFPA